MKKEIIHKLHTSFEDVVHEQDGIEFWLARDLQVLLGYDEWRNFTKVIEKAKEASKNVGQDPGDHFVETNKLITHGKGGQRSIADFMLTRYACYLIAQNGEQRARTIILRYMKSILIASFLLFGLNCTQNMDESAAIQALLEKESATWRAGDFKAHADCWHIRDYSKILVSNTSGQTFDVPPALMKDPSAAMGDGGSSVNSNYKMSIHGDHAWVSHDEISTAKDGEKTYSHEIRILEKIDGQWKLVAQSIHAYLP